MKTAGKDAVLYEVVRSRRSTADIIVDRDGGILVRVPEWVHDDKVEEIVNAKRLWIFRSLAGWKDMNATRVLGTSSAVSIGSENGSPTSPPRWA